MTAYKDKAGMLHVVIISPLFAVNEQDSVNVPFLQIYCRELIKHNIQLSIIAEQYPLQDNYEWNGVKVYTLKKTTSRIRYKFSRKRRLLKTLGEIHRAKPIDIIHNFWFNILGKISEAFALQHKIRHITSLSGQDILLEKNPYIAEITGYSGTLICPSQFHKNRLLENYNVPVQVIPLGIEDITPTFQERRIDLIQCGWINSVKNNGQFLEIVKTLADSGDVSRVVMCGGGPMFEEVTAQVKALGLDKLIEMRNSIPREEVVDLMQQSKILVHTSNFESFGLVLAEGLACDCIVISTPVGIAADDSGIVRCKGISEFVSAIRTHLQNYKTPEKSRNRYPVSRTVDSYLKIYTNG